MFPARPPPWATTTFFDGLRYGVVAAKPYLDGSDPSGGFIERKSDDHGFDGGESIPGGVCTPQVRMVKVLAPDGTEVSHHYERYWASSPDKEDDGFD